MEAKTKPQATVVNPSSSTVKVTEEQTKESLEHAEEEKPLDQLDRLVGLAKAGEPSKVWLSQLVAANWRTLRLTFQK